MTITTYADTLSFNGEQYSIKAECSNEENRMPTSEQTIVKRVTELVAADSVSSPDPSWDSSNRRVINHLYDYAQCDGWAVDIHELESTADGKANLIATLGNTDNLGDEPAGWCSQVTRTLSLLMPVVGRLIP